MRTCLFLLLVVSNTSYGQTRFEKPLEVSQGTFEHIIEMSFRGKGPYTIYRSEHPSFKDYIILEKKHPHSSYADRGLVPATNTMLKKSYYYQIQYADGSLSPIVEGFVAYKKSTKRVSAPIPLNLSDGTWAWIAQPNATKYRIQVVLAKNDDVVKAVRPKTTAILKDITLNQNTFEWKGKEDVYWAVQAISGTDSSHFSIYVKSWAIARTQGTNWYSDVPIQLNLVSDFTYSMENPLDTNLKSIVMGVFLSNASVFDKATYAQTIQSSKNSYGQGYSDYKDAQLIDAQHFEILYSKEKRRFDLPKIEAKWKTQYTYIHIVPFVNGKMVKSSIVIKKL